MVLLLLLRLLLLVALLRFSHLQLLLLFASVQKQAFVGVRSSPVKQLTGLSVEGRRLRRSQFVIVSIQYSRLHLPRNEFLVTRQALQSNDIRFSLGVRR